MAPHYPDAQGAGLAFSRSTAANGLVGLRRRQAIPNLVVTTRPVGDHRERRAVGDREPARASFREDGAQPPVQSLAGIFAAGCDPQRIIEEGIQQAAAVLEVDYCAVFEAGPDSESLRLLGCVETGDAGERSGGRPIGLGLAWEALRQGRSVLMDRPRCPGDTVEGAFRLGMAVLIGPSARPLGVLAAYSLDPNGFSDDVGERVQTAANLICIGLQHFELRHALHRERRALQAVWSVTRRMAQSNGLEDAYPYALESLGRAMGSARLALLLRDPDGVMRVKAWQGLSNLCRQSLEACPLTCRNDGDPNPSVVEDIAACSLPDPIKAVIREEGIGSVVFVPLVHAGRVLGEIMVCYDVARRFNEDEWQLAETIASQVAFGIGHMAAQAALVDSQDRLRAVISNAPLVLFAMDAQGTFVLSEGRGLAALGLRPGEVVGRSVFDLYGHVPQIVEDARRALAGRAFSSVVEVGGLVFESWYGPLRGREGEVSGVIGVATDVTQRVRAQEAVRQSESRYRSLFEHANDAILVIDPDTHRLLEVNQHAATRLGYTPQEMLSLTLQQVCPSMTRRRLDAMARRLRRGGHVLFEHTHRGKDGTDIPVETNSRLIDYAGRQVLLHFVRDIADRKRAEEALRRAHDDLERRVRERTANLVAANERLQAEISERKRVEQRIREREAELAHVSRLSTMGEMAATMAHEINQPLAAIANYAAGCLHRLKGGSGDIDELLQAVEQITLQAHRAGDIVHRLRRFVRKREPRRVMIDINEAVREAVGFVTQEARRFGVRLRVELADKLPPVSADIVQIEQVVLNLLRNAVEATKGLPAQRRAVVLGTVLAAGRVEVSVRDRGPGLPMELAGPVFQPFFTTKPDGMGMGLAISQSIVTAHGGQLWAESVAQQGTTFHFSLPVGRPDGDAA